MIKIVLYILPNIVKKKQKSVAILVEIGKKNYCVHRKVHEGSFVVNRADIFK